MILLPGLMGSLTISVANDLYEPNWEPMTTGSRPLEASGTCLVRAGLLIIWLQLDVPVSASFWNVAGTLLAAWGVLGPRW